MAGEVIQQIKDKEGEASDLVAKARAEAKKLLEETRTAKAGLIEEKDKLLQRDEAAIKDTYTKETAQAVSEIEEEEKGTVQRIKAACEKNLHRVVDYITSEIVKE